MNNLNKLISAQSSYANTQAQINSSLTELRKATFCYVTSINEKLCTINCQPVVKESVNSSNGPVFMKLPELINVPYTPNTPSVGDYCLCIHLDRSIGEILQKRKNYVIKGKNAITSDDVLKTINSTGRKHGLNDCIAITGIFKPNDDVIVDKIYPIGSVYMSTVDNDPSNIFKNTTWERLQTNISNSIYVWKRIS